MEYSKSEIDILTGQIQKETEHYFEAVTRNKDLTLARNLKVKIRNLQKLLDARVQGNIFAMVRIR
jgi:hypothetical protein